MNQLRLKRLNHNDNTTIGVMFLDGQYICCTLEDEPRLQKVYGKTRIPAGTYDIKFREEGRLHQKYKEKFSFHKGMLWLQDVPNFEYIYIHIGNTHIDTLGCILVGDAFTVNGDKLYNSTAAYQRLYSRLIGRKDITIKIEDE